jgi:hypothetical protein
MLDALWQLRCGLRSHSLAVFDSVLWIALADQFAGMPNGIDAWQHALAVARAEAEAVNAA